MIPRFHVIVHIEKHICEYCCQIPTGALLNPFRHVRNDLMSYPSPYLRTSVLPKPKGLKALLRWVGCGSRARQKELCMYEDMGAIYWKKKKIENVREEGNSRVRQRESNQTRIEDWNELKPKELRFPADAVSDVGAHTQTRGGDSGPGDRTSNMAARSSAGNPPSGLTDRSGSFFKVLVCSVSAIVRYKRKPCLHPVQGGDVGPVFCFTLLYAKGAKQNLIDTFALEIGELKKEMVQTSPTMDKEPTELRG
ncbi:hypothetical protein F2P81_010722 [Scophthalmus maximus]|uniref:Uncharacterized protein n=1 Tax=Scophthalmus maximus TaxID=52904 RepID=A0A6A4T0M0_SCOMX|nr:hypothetical protein F2P81_010722 [Scophthalmus maximus]